MTKRRLKITALALLATAAAGFLAPERLEIPVQGATPADWNHDTFWHHPWGVSGTHKGIDIFAAEGRAVISAGPGMVVFRGHLGYGGQVVIALGPKWRFHYYAHLSRIDAGLGDWLSRGEAVGAVGTTGNAAGKPAHLHYSIFTPIPYPWRTRSGPLGFLRPFFLNPHDKLLENWEPALS